ncbi:hypothetical protein ACFOJE_00390 [Azotobacter bryophylli]|uniref:Uncharacterized protein n=1 Tax=Azotobacter bryophylli TaxID=1986537 RepID=A0ABV7ANX8_9GAMM
MQVNVRPISSPLGHWQVQFGKVAVTFRSENEARQFVNTLETRLKAPHPWPTSQQYAGS